MRGRDSSRVLTRSQRGFCICCSSWQALVVTESTPAHQSREKSQGLFTTNRFTEILSWCRALWKWGEMEEHTEFAQLTSETLPWTHSLLCRSLQCRIMLKPFSWPTER
jgi:hypothetical protein|uniref:Uncharacterized protein n=1 Tax=Mus musculus TaxID=10090 RepID=Q3TZ23_MOUSE|nr:unnamed protein product [Mus musculus]